MRKEKIIERSAAAVCLLCATMAIFAVMAISIYLLLKGIPAFKEVGIGNLLGQSVWQPTAAQPAYGVQYIILTSLLATCLSVVIAVPIALLTAVFLTEIANKTLSSIVAAAVEIGRAHV